jgi:hypothetical protein
MKPGSSIHCGVVSGSLPDLELLPLTTTTYFSPPLAHQSSPLPVAWTSFSIWILFDFFALPVFPISILLDYMRKSGRC